MTAVHASTSPSEPSTLSPRATGQGPSSGSRPRTRDFPQPRPSGLGEAGGIRGRRKPSNEDRKLLLQPTREGSETTGSES